MIFKHGIVMDIDTLIDNFVLVNYSSEISRRNVKYYLKWLKRYLEANNKNLSELTPRDILDFRGWISKQKGRHGKYLSAKSIRQLLSLIKVFFAFLETYGYNNPFRGLPSYVIKKIFPREKTEKVPREFTDYELELIFNTMKKRNSMKNANKDAYLVCLLAYATGARLNEILSINAEDIFVKDNDVFIIIRKGKGEKERIAIVGCPGKSDIIKRLNKEVRDLLLRKKRKVKNGPIFRDAKKLRKIVQMYLYRLSKKMKKRIYIHAFRSNWGIKALQEGIPLEYISFQLGHKYTETTEKYYARVKDITFFSVITRFIQQ